MTRVIIRIGGALTNSVQGLLIITGAEGKTRDDYCVCPSGSAARKTIRSPCNFYPGRLQRKSARKKFVVLADSAL